MERKGFILQPRFIFIDGRTGAILYSETFHEEMLYPQNQSVPALSTYFELMDRRHPVVPQHAQRPEDPRHARPPQVDRLWLRKGSTFEAARLRGPSRLPSPKLPW